MKQFKKGDTLTLEDVRQSFQKINNKGVNEGLDLNRYRIGEDGSILFDSEEEYEAAFGGTVSFEEAFKW